MLPTGDRHPTRSTQEIPKVLADMPGQTIVPIQFVLGASVPQSVTSCIDRLQLQGGTLPYNAADVFLSFLTNPQAHLQAAPQAGPLLDQQALKSVSVTTPVLDVQDTEPAKVPAVSGKKKKKKKKSRHKDSKKGRGGDPNPSSVDQ